MNEHRQAEGGVEGEHRKITVILPAFLVSSGTSIHTPGAKKSVGQSKIETYKW